MNPFILFLIRIYPIYGKCIGDGGNVYGYCGYIACVLKECHTSHENECVWILWLHSRNI